jgi:[ribosomal protein S5]-alanine N-acetyltransferase
VYQRIKEDSKVTLPTRRLELVPASTKHTKTIVTLIKEDNKNLSTWTTIPFPNRANKTKEFIKKAQSNYLHFLYFIKIKKSKELIGGIDIKIEPSNNSATVGYWMGSQYRNQGYMTEAVKKIIQFGFKEKALNKIIIRTNPKNKGSIRIIEKCNLKYEGLLRQECLNGLGKYCDLKTYSILKREWRK